MWHHTFLVKFKAGTKILLKILYKLIWRHKESFIVSSTNSYDCQVVHKTSVRLVPSLAWLLVFSPPPSKYSPSYVSQYAINRLCLAHSYSRPTLPTASLKGVSMEISSTVRGLSDPSAYPITAEHLVRRCATVSSAIPHKLHPGSLFLSSLCK